MAARLRVSWQNWPGAPGLSTFYFLQAPTQAEVDAVRTFFNALAALIPSGLTITVPNSGDIFTGDNGGLTDVWSVPTAPAVVTGTGAGVYAGNAGAVVHWLTTGVVNGRRVRGRTFLVPLIGSAYSTSGAILASALTTITGAATAYATSGDANRVVWSRPYVDPKGIKPSRPGSISSITGTRVPNLAVSMRSRRV